MLLNLHESHTSITQRPTRSAWAAAPVPHSEVSSLFAAGETEADSRRSSRKTEVVGERQERLAASAESPGVTEDGLGGVAAILGEDRPPPAPFSTVPAPVAIKDSGSGLARRL